MGMQKDGEVLRPKRQTDEPCLIERYNFQNVLCLCEQINVESSATSICGAWKRPYRSSTSPPSSEGR